jgi:hypothetical protein
VIDAVSGAIYVIGGTTSGPDLQDVWVSTDGGARAGLGQGGWIGGYSSGVLKWGTRVGYSTGVVMGY